MDNYLALVLSAFINSGLLEVIIIIIFFLWNIKVEALNTLTSGKTAWAIKMLTYAMRVHLNLSVYSGIGGSRH